MAAFTIEVSAINRAASVTIGGRIGDLLHTDHWDLGEEMAEVTRARA